ncbi:MAG: Nicotinamide-nucleotide amidohydrolase PncC [Pseudomonadota bacterium]|jgi:PncC family amidohydrolase
MIFPNELLEKAAHALAAADQAGVRIVTAETVTAGLVSACLTSVPGASRIFERGFVLYHDSAKASGLGLDESIAAEHGAVSAAITAGLAEGALAHSGAGISVAITGYAGPGGGSDRDPVGTCYIATAQRGAPSQVERHLFAGDRNAVRTAALACALEALARRLSTG